MKQANELYTSGNFKEAAQRYEAIIGQGYTSAEVYYNLGNAYFKMKDIPAAILNYERANLLSPKDEDIQFNLDLARTYVVDKIEPLPEFMLVIAAKNFRSWWRKWLALTGVLQVSQRDYEQLGLDSKPRQQKKR